MIGVARGEGRKQGKRNLSTYLANIFRDRLYPRASHDHDHLLCISILSSLYPFYACCFCAAMLHH